MRKLKTIIVDDEELARSIVREYLEKYEDIRIVAECANGFEAVKAVSEHSPDLLLLDIQMPKINGFELLELLQDPPAVIFITAYDEFALRAFEVHAVDYLLKPFSEERFAEALSRAKTRLTEAERGSYKPILEAVRKDGPPPERILIKDGPHVHVVPLGTIDYFEAKDDYVAIKAGGKRYLKQKRLTDIEKELQGTQFIRTHRSFIVNVERIMKIELYAKDSRIATLRDGTKIPISRARYDSLKQVFR
jgi:two-component system, LytTR family, response regulator